VSKALSNRLPKYASLAPAVVFFLALAVLPVANLFWISFHEVVWESGKSTRTWVGLENYLAIPKDSLFRASISNTIIFVLVATSIQVVIGLALALICAAIGPRSRIYRAIFILPILIPGIIIGAIWRLMYNFEFGIINQALDAVNIAAVDWLGSSSLALGSVIAVDVWHWTPFSFLLLLAAVEGLPKELSEAAKVDGASIFQELWRITLPLLLPAIVTTFLFRAVIAFKVFDEVYLLTSGGPGTSTEVISYTIFQRFFLQDNAGYGSALSVTVIFVVAIIIAISLGVSSSRSAK